MTRRRWELPALGVWSLWYSLGWLSGDLLPVGMTSVTGAGVRLLLIGLLGACLCLVIRSEIDWVRLARLAGMGGGLVALPFLLLDSARGMASANLGVVVFALVPVAVMIVEGSLRLLPWGLAGVAGILMVAPVTLPATGRGFLGLGLQVLAAWVTGFGLVATRRLLQGVGFAEALAAVGVGSGVPLLLAGTLIGNAGWSVGVVEAEMVRAAVVDLPEVALLVWLVREMPAVQVGARYLAAPLLTVVEGWLMVREGLGVRTSVAMLLLGTGVYGCLRGQMKEEEIGLGLH